MTTHEKQTGTQNVSQSNYHTHIHTHTHTHTHHSLSSLLRQVHRKDHDNRAGANIVNSRKKTRTRI
jgi:hypothetical protein